MKKLNLKKLKLDDNHMLRRDQLKTVFGGYSGASECSAKCDDEYGNEWSVYCDGESCEAYDWVGCYGSNGNVECPGY